MNALEFLEQEKKPDAMGFLMEEPKGSAMDFLTDRSFVDKSFDYLKGQFSEDTNVPVDVPVIDEGQVSSGEVFGMDQVTRTALRQTAQDMVPYLKYIDPEERERFSQLATNDQTRELLMENLDAIIMTALPAYGKAAARVISPLFERLLPKTFKFLTKEIKFGGKPTAPVETTPEIKPTEVTPKAMEFLEPKVETAPGEIVQPGATSGGKQAIKVFHQSDTGELKLGQDVYGLGEGYFVSSKKLPKGFYGKKDTVQYLNPETKLFDFQQWAKDNNRKLMVPPEKRAVIIEEATDIARKEGYDGIQIMPDDIWIFDKKSFTSTSPSPLPEAAKGGAGKQPWEMTREELETKYIKAGDVVDGRKVRSEIPNMDSIESSVENSTVLPGVYEIPLSEFEGGLTGKHYSVSGTKRIAELADEIANSKEINPLIVVIDKEGPYILEGATRAEALYKSGAKSLPAKVVLDEGSFYRAAEKAVKEGKPVSPEVLKDYPELAKKGETGLDALAKEQTALAQKGMIGIDISPKGPKSTYKFESPETETLFQSAKGVKGESIINRIKAVATEVGHKFTRDFEHLANNKENAQLIFDLKRLEKQKNVVADRTTRSIGETVSGLNKAEYDMFSRKAILDDLSADVERGLYAGEKELPFKFSADSLTAEKNKLDALVQGNPKIAEAMSKRQAMWDQVKSEYIEALSPYKTGVEDMFKENYYRHQVLEYVESNGIFGTGKRLKTPTGKGYTKSRAGVSDLYNTDYLEAEHQIMSQMLHDIETAKTITKIQATEDIAKQIRAKAKTEEITNWKKAIPEGYTVWQPKEGNVFRPVLTVDEKVAEKIMSGEIDELMEGGGKLFKNAMAVGGRRKEWVVRQEVADTLDNLVREKAKGIISSADLQIMTSWKKWQLISPRRYFKYNTRNLTGDAEAVFLGNMNGFKKAPQATKELSEVFFQKKPMSPELAAWFERGGMSSTLQAQEMDTLKQAWMFSRLYEKRGASPDLWNRYWTSARITTDFRESILRYSNFLDFKEQIIRNNGKPLRYGASKPEMIDALADIDDKAYWLSNDLLGAYDRVSVAGQALRERVMPFWSWQEVNFKRYVQLYKNAANDGELAVSIGKKAGAKTVTSALSVGRLAIKTAAFASALAVYNNTVFPEEEKKLPIDVRTRPHIILGTDDKGNIEYFNRMGTLDDFISWFGLDYAPRFVNEYLSGKKTFKELIHAQAKETMEAPVNKVVQGSMPFTKLAGELITRKAAFPDVFKPGTIRDRYLHIARSIGLENEYAAMAGKPSKGYAESLKGLFFYKVSPGEAAYRTVYDLKANFMKKLGRTSEGFWLTPTGDALYNMKLAMKYEDKKAFSKYFSEYVSLASAQGKTDKQIRQGIQVSIKTMHPLSGMNGQIQKAFVTSLTPEENTTLARAIMFYNDTLSVK